MKSKFSSSAFRVESQLHGSAVPKSILNTLGCSLFSCRMPVSVSDRMLLFFLCLEVLVESQESQLLGVIVCKWLPAPSSTPRATASKTTIELDNVITVVIALQDVVPMYTVDRPG